MHFDSEELNHDAKIELTSQDLDGSTQVFRRLRISVLLREFLWLHPYYLGLQRLGRVKCRMRSSCYNSRDNMLCSYCSKPHLVYHKHDVDLSLSYFLRESNHFLNLNMDMKKILSPRDHCCDMDLMMINARYMVFDDYLLQRIPLTGSRGKLHLCHWLA